MTRSTQASPSLWRRIRSIHPGLVLAALDLLGLIVASYLTYEETVGRGKIGFCPVGGGCQTVANSEYSHIAGIPVAGFGVVLSITLFCLAIYWWRTNDYKILLAHYGLSLIGVLFEGWFQFAQIVLIHAVCFWCETYGLSLVLRFVIALWVYLRTPKPTEFPADEPA
jgi:uncharacterized membrane protein